MADLLLSELIAGQLHHSVIISALSTNAPILFKNINVHISEFIPYFLAYLREKLTQSHDSKGSSTYYSPRQKEEQKKAEQSKVKAKQQAKANTSGGVKSARLSLQYPSSSPVKKITNNDSFQSSSSIGFNGISPIKCTEPKKVETKKCTTISVLSTNGDSSFELGSFDDFPSMSAAPVPNKK